MEQAKDDLVERKGIDKAEITVAALEAVKWPDTSLGCPQPDTMYAQVITTATGPYFAVVQRYTCIISTGVTVWCIAGAGLRSFCPLRQARDSCLASMAVKAE